MFEPPVMVTLKSPAETADLAARLGTQLQAGDCLLLDGPIGAGKTHFARHLIQSLLEQPEDVPSPTYTLVQTYDTRSGEVWHADLYRLTSLEEIEELGLAEAFEAAICLVEWPDRLGPLTPDDALRLEFELGEPPGVRHVGFHWRAARWSPVVRQVCNG